MPACLATLPIVDTPTVNLNEFHFLNRRYTFLHPPGCAACFVWFMMPKPAVDVIE